MAAGNYIAKGTLLDFHRSDAFVRGIRGPVGSGKSTGCCMEIMSRASEQKPGPDRIRHSRWVVTRDTYPELSDSTIKTWMDWFPNGTIGHFNVNRSTYFIKYRDIEAEVMFRALDRPQDVSKLLSTELTGAWMNEAKNSPKAILDVLTDRVGMYPAIRNGGCTWSGVFMDTNSPDDDHWWYKLAEEDRPYNFEFFDQPGGLIEVDGEFVENPLAENLDHLEPHYYLKRSGGKEKDYIRVYYCNQYGFVKEGKPVHPEYVDAIHCTPDPISPVPGLIIHAGLDFGLTPAATFAQRLPNGRWIFIDEVVSEDIGIQRFIELGLHPKMNGEYAGYTFSFFGDPAGDKRADTDEKTPYQILRANGINAQPCFTNDPTVRRGALQGPFGRMIDGKPGLMVSPRCKMLRKGLAGGFYYKRVQISGEERFRDEPYKNGFSHVVESAEYCLTGAGEGKALLGKTVSVKPRVTVSSIMASVDLRSGL